MYSNKKYNKKQNGFASEFPFFDGVLTNDPFCTKEIKAGLELNFEAQHIIDIYEG